MDLQAGATTGGLMLPPCRHAMSNSRTRGRRRSTRLMGRAA